MVYDIKCKSCDYADTWVCSASKYSERIKDECPNCSEKTLFQDMSEVKGNFILKGDGWTVGGVRGKGYHKKGSQEDLDDALRENDHLAEKAEKDPKWKAAREKADEQKAKTEAKITQAKNGVNID